MPARRHSRHRLLHVRAPELRQGDVVIDIDDPTQPTDTDDPFVVILAEPKTRYVHVTDRHHRLRRVPQASRVEVVR